MISRASRIASFLPRLRTGLAVAAGAALTLSAVAATPAVAQRSEQGAARKEMKAGNVLSLREIERRILPTMKGYEYLGPAYDSAAMAYRLKFIKDGRVVFVDVDARTGRVINRTR
ncbi:PepSY domain-containing protein [Alteripontixanthobacter muriae]|uniref:PepSY domain-containing protein n=1 Tax=Alteripontixanthobacter muriae TaxID=2705546 RepID=UPI001E511EAE|nr:PepSY domain-containing protein [Alteripontixanthobacter muriae]